MNSSISILKGIHPGFFLERELKKRAIRKSAFAFQVHEYPQTITSITKGRRDMNLPLSLRIEKALELEEGFLMMLQLYYDIEKEKNKSYIQPDLSKIRPVVFWDTNLQHINWTKQKTAVIKRIFERCNDTEKEEITRFYGKDAIASALKNTPFYAAL